MSTNPDFGTLGRYQELLVEEMTPDQKKAYEFTTSERGEVPGPYKIWLQNPKLIDVMVPLGAYIALYRDGLPAGTLLSCRAVT